jgi:Lipid A core - O-antigen ligase and related enzymes
MSFFGARTWATRGFGFTKWGLAGPPGFFANSGEFSLLMAMVAVISLAFLMKRDHLNKIYFLLPITASMTVLGASSRGGQIALIVGLLYIGFTIGKLKVKNLIYIGLAGYIGFSLLPQEQKDRFSNMGDDNTSTSRLNYWNAGIEMMNKYPFFGVGHYGFPEYYATHYSHHKKDVSDYLKNRREVAHNSFVQVGSTLGYLGLASYTYLLLLCYFFTRRIRKMSATVYLQNTPWVAPLSTGLDAAIIVYIIGSSFMSVAFYPYIYLMLMFNQSLYNAVRHESSPSKVRAT